jgi:hypothetical protein
MDLSPQTTTTTGLSDKSWLQSTHGIDMNRSITLDLSLFDPTLHYPDGSIRSGTVLGRVTATGLYGPYGGTSDEVQTVTEGGSGLTSFTLTFSGQTTGAIAAGATAAAVQTALEALSNIGAGNVLVSGSAGGPYTVKFVGDLADTNVAQMTATPTGGTGTVTVATTTAGGADIASDGREIAAGHLFEDERVNAGSTKAGAALFRHGGVVEANLPANHGLDAAAKADLAGQILYS